MTFAEVHYSLSHVAIIIFKVKKYHFVYSYFAIRINLCLYFIHVNCNTVLCNTFFMYHTVVTCRLKMMLIKKTQDFLLVNQGKEESVAQFEDQQQLTKRRKYQYPNVYKYSALLYLWQYSLLLETNSEKPSIWWAEHSTRCYYFWNSINNSFHTTSSKMVIEMYRQR